MLIRYPIVPEDEDPGNCIHCGEPFELLRPGKGQPTCNCYNYCYEHGPPVKLEDWRGPKIFGLVCPVCIREIDL